MLIPTIILGVFALTLILIGYSRGGGLAVTGIKAGLALFVQILPLLLFALIGAGMVQVLLSGEAMSNWVGAESGMRGILLGTVAGGLTPGGPYVSLPITAGLLHSGASVGTMIAFLTGWSLWSISRLPMDVGIIGWKLSLIRLSCTFFFPPIAGLLAQAFFGRNG